MRFGIVLTALYVLRVLRWKCCVDTFIVVAIRHRCSVSHVVLATAAQRIYLLHRSFARVFVYTSRDPAKSNAFPPSHLSFYHPCALYVFLGCFLNDAGAVLAAFGDIFYDVQDEKKRVSLVFVGRGGPLIDPSE